MRTQDQLITHRFHVLDRAVVVFQDSVHVGLAFAVRLERVVVAIDEERGAGEKTGIHAHAFASVGPDEHKTLPARTITFDVRFQLLKKTFLEFHDVLDVHADEKRMRSGHSSISDKNILKFVIAGRQNRSALVHLRGVKQVQDREMLDGQDAIHAFEAESALAIQKIGDVSLFEAGLLCQAETSEIAFFNPLPKSIAKIFLQNSEFHWGSIA